MLMPRRVKHRKQHHPKRRGAAKGGTKLAFGDFGIQAVEPTTSPTARSSPLVSP
jgi:large subunit ribosomal protein L16